MGVATQASLEELVWKYREMLAMRLDHIAGEEDVVRAQARMLALASRFPGALREIDRLELDAIRERIRKLEVTLGGEGPVEPWMSATALFHAFTRGALWAKRWLAGRKAVSDTMVNDYERAAGQLDATKGGPLVGNDFTAPAARVEVLAWAGQLERIASPPRGRIIDVVFARVAECVATTEDEARRLVFGESSKAKDPAPGSEPSTEALDDA